MTSGFGTFQEIGGTLTVVFCTEGVTVQILDCPRTIPQVDPEPLRPLLGVRCPFCSQRSLRKLKVFTGPDSGCEDSILTL